jgi:hypothetical protein
MKKIILILEDEKDSLIDIVEKLSNEEIHDTIPALIVTDKYDLVPVLIETDEGAFEKIK